MPTGTNNVANVSTTKGVSGGYFFSAPSTSTAPTNFSTDLPADFVCLGYISEDGVAETIETDTTNLKDMNGDDVYTVMSSRTETIKATLLEVAVPALKEIYGQDMVTVDAQDNIIYSCYDRHYSLITQKTRELLERLDTEIAHGQLVCLSISGSGFPSAKSEIGRARLMTIWGSFSSRTESRPVITTALFSFR